MATLVIYRGDNVVDRIALGRRDLRIGRAPDNDLPLPDPGKAVSRFHAELRYESGQYVLLDLNSSNGLWIDGRRLQREPLRDGAVVTIGPYRMVLEGATDGAPVEIEPPAVPVAPAAPGTETVLAAGSVRHRTPPPFPPRPVGHAKRPTARPESPSAPGLIARLERLPRPVLFGGFGAILLLIIVAGQIVNQQPAGGSSTPTAGVTAEHGVPRSEPTSSNADRIARHLAAGKLALEENRAAEAKEQFELALLSDRENGEALELKARAEEALRSQQRAAAPQSSSSSGEAPAQAESAASAQGAPVLPTGAAPADRADRAEPPRRHPAAPERAGRGSSSRERELQSRYDAARALLERGDYQGAERALAALVEAAPEFMDAAALLDRARAAERQATRAAAAAAVVEGNRLFDEGNPKAAFDAYERAQKLDAAVEGAAPGITRARQRMRELGEDAFKRARQYDAVGRTPEALALYERAVQLLPDDHPSRAIARDRATALKGIAR